MGGDSICNVFIISKTWIPTYSPFVYLIKSFEIETQIKIENIFFKKNIFQKVNKWNQCFSFTEAKKKTKQKKQSKKQIKDHII